MPNPKDEIDADAVLDAQEPACPHCGGPLEWIECHEPDCQDGYTSLYEEDPFFYDPDDLEECDVCHGRGGWYQCLSCRRFVDADDV